jgi:molybdopterin-guanine dinucleotide biosynthesis protein A
LYVAQDRNLFLRHLMPIAKLPITAALLFGPRSRPFGVPKAFLPWGTGSLAAQIIRQSHRCFQEVVAVSKEVDWIPRDAQGTVPLYLDRWPELGPQAGLATVLPLALHDPVLLLSCHQPVFREEVFRGLWRLWKRSEKLDVLVPFVKGRYLPFRSLWSKSALRALKPGAATSLEEVLEKGGLRVKHVGAAAIHQWDPGLGSLRELESLQDWMEIGAPQE